MSCHILYDKTQKGRAMMTLISVARGGFVGTVCPVWRELARDRTFNSNPQPRTRGFIAMRQAPKFHPGRRQAFLDEETAEAV